MPIIFVLRYRSGEMRLAARHENSGYFAPFLARYEPHREDEAQQAAKALAKSLDCRYSDEIRDLL